MRKVLNISLPAEMEKEVNKAVKKGHYATKSEFFRYLLRFWKEEEALKELRKSQKEITEGKGRVLKSLKDLR